MYRQGDVLVVPTDRGALPAGLVPAARDARRRMVLALGEATGHAHVLTGDGVELWCPPDAPDTLFITVERYGRLGHEEHRPVPLPPGAYRVFRQREYLPGSVRPVAD